MMGCSSSIRGSLGDSLGGSNHSRSGAILICVLACSLIAALLAAATIQLSLRNMKEVRLVQQRRQALWIVGAGVQRAKQRLSDPDYRGETWIVPQSVTHSEAASVRIEVNADDAGAPDVGSGESPKADKREAEDRETNADLNAQRSTSRTLIVTVRVEYERENASGIAIQQSHSFRYERGAKPRDATP